MVVVLLLLLLLLLGLLSPVPSSSGWVTAMSARRGLSSFSGVQHSLAAYRTHGAHTTCLPHYTWGAFWGGGCAAGGGITTAFWGR